MDSKHRRTKLFVAALALAVAGAVGAAPYAANTGPDYLVTPGTASQCDLPLAQRTGGWVCPTP